MQLMTAPPFDPIRHRRGGRPPKPDDERRGPPISLRLSPDELEAARTRARTAGMSLSAFARAALGSTPIYVTMVQEAPPEIVHQLRMMGNNLNQALADARRGSFARPDTEAALIAAAQIIAAELRTVLHGPEHH